MGLNRLKPRGQSPDLCSCCSFFRERYVLPFSSLSSSDEAPDGERRLELEIISLMISGRDSKKGTLVAAAVEGDAAEDGGGDGGGGGLAANASSLATFHKAWAKFNLNSSNWDAIQTLHVFYNFV